MTTNKLLARIAKVDEDLELWLADLVRHRPAVGKKRHTGKARGSMTVRKHFKCFGGVPTGAKVKLPKYVPGFYLSRKKAPEFVV